MHCEVIHTSGNFCRTKLKDLASLCKQVNTNPSHGPTASQTCNTSFARGRKHVPHKTKRGQATLDRLKGVDGIPLPQDKKNPMVAPAALRVMCLKPSQKFADLGCLAHEASGSTR